jgi:hypothetical protein
MKKPVEEVHQTSLVSEEAPKKKWWEIAAELSKDDNPDTLEFIKEKETLAPINPEIEMIGKGLEEKAKEEE